MGEVYSAEDPWLHRRVALKRISPARRDDRHYRERLLREARRASQLSHPHVAAIYDVLEQQDELFLVMEYVEGQTLRERAREPFTIDEAIQIAAQCAAALRAAHAAGILHCDIKPDNIMLASSGSGGTGPQVKVLDFGVAKMLPGSDEDGSTSVTETAGLSGTPGYMAPEILRGHQADGRADIFSLGVVAYEMLAGSNPFRAETIFACAERILNEDPPPLRRVNPVVTPELEAVVGKMLAKNPELRYANTDELVSDLKSVQGSPEFGRMIATVIPARKCHRGLIMTCIGLVLLVGFLLAAYRAGTFRRWIGGMAVKSRNIAVLPFEVANEGAGAKAFSNGLAETVAAKLTQLADRYPLQVVSPAEVREQGVTTTEQARQLLGVNLVLTGSLRAAGDQVRVNYRLVDAATRQELRGDAITASAANPFAMEDKVVDGVLNSLEIALAPNERQALTAHRTAEPRAYDFYLQGRGYLQEFQKPENLDSAIQVFGHALELDSNYALAYAGMGEAYAYKYDTSKDPRAIETARARCARAAELDPSAAEAHICLGMVRQRTGDYDKAVAELRQAVELAPANADAYRWLARAFEQKKDLLQAEATYKRAIAQRPDYWSGYNALGVFYFAHSRYDDGIGMFNKVASLTPDNFRGYSNLGAVYLARGDYPKAASFFERSVAIQPSGDALSNLGITYFYMRQFARAAEVYERAAALLPREHIVWSNLGEAYYWTPGKRDQARRPLTKATELVEDDLRVNPHDLSALEDGARCQAMLGNEDRAQDYLRRALAVAPDDAELLYVAAAVQQLFGHTDQALQWLAKSRAAGYGPERLRDDPSFESLKNDPRFQKLIEK
jgi:serine/threonine-protein kinase